MNTTIVSIGYEKRKVDDLIQVLEEYEVSKLLDVRQIPISRKKGFSKTVLSQSLSSAGIEYKHIKVAGNPHHSDKENIGKCLRLYSNYLRKNPDIISVVASELGNRTVAIMCYERSHKCCHRSVLLDELTKSGYMFSVVNPM